MATTTTGARAVHGSALGRRRKRGGGGGFGPLVAVSALSLMAMMPPAAHASTGNGYQPPPPPSSSSSLRDPHSSSLPPPPRYSEKWVQRRTPPPASLKPPSLGGTAGDESEPGPVASPSQPQQGQDTAFPFAAHRFQQQQLYEQQHQRWLSHQSPQTPSSTSSQSTGERVLPHLPRLLRAVGGVGISILFMILTARVSHLYDLVDQITHPIIRYTLIFPMVFLLISDALGIVISLMSNLNPGRSRTKVRLKLVIGCNAIAEVLNLLLNITQLILAGGSSSSKWPPREVYLGRVFTSIWMLSIIYTFSSSRWDSDDSYRPSTS